MTLACAKLTTTSALPVVISYRIAVTTNLMKEWKEGMVCLGVIVSEGFCSSWHMGSRSVWKNQEAHWALNQGLVHPPKPCIGDLPMRPHFLKIHQIPQIVPPNREQVLETWACGKISHPSGVADCYISPCLRSTLEHWMESWFGNLMEDIQIWWICHCHKLKISHFS